jgi:hypothetical protein
MYDSTESAASGDVWFSNRLLTLANDIEFQGHHRAAIDPFVRGINANLQRFGYVLYMDSRTFRDAFEQWLALQEERSSLLGMVPEIKCEVCGPHGMTDAFFDACRKLKHRRKAGNKVQSKLPELLIKHLFLCRSRDRPG